MNYNITTTIIGIGLASAIFYLVRRDHLHGPYAYWWLSVAAAIAVFGFYPQLIDKMAAFSGITYAPTLLFSLTIGAMLIKMLKGDIERSRHERQIRRLAQQLAILSEENDRLKIMVEEEISSTPIRSAATN